jgi:hypothetical protein
MSAPRRLASADLKFRYLLAFLVVWLSIAIVTSFYTSFSTEPIVVTFFLLVAVSVLIVQLARRSVGFGFFPGSANGSHGQKSEGVSKMVFLIENASKSRAYGRREIAKILRESLLTQAFGQKGFPVDWIATPNGDGAIDKILRSKNNSELQLVFDLPDVTTRSKVLTSASNDGGYLDVLARSLSMIEGKR